MLENESLSSVLHDISEPLPHIIRCSTLVFRDELQSPFDLLDARSQIALAIFDRLPGEGDPVQVKKVEYLDFQTGYIHSAYTNPRVQTKLTAWARIQLTLALICQRVLACSMETIKLDFYTPNAAVFNVPKGRFLSETGSQTSISPSRIILSIAGN